MDTESANAASPPYGSFRTFWSFIDTLAERPLPPQIDGSILDKKSGTDRIGILMALKKFELIAGEDQSVTPALDAVVRADKDQRREALAAILRRHYPKQLEVSERNGTETMLNESFSTDFGLNGDTRRKAVTWFLHAAQEAGIKLSPHFPQIRSGSGGNAGGARVKRQTTRKRTTATGTVKKPVTQREDQQPDGDEYTVKLKAGGTVTLRVSVGHFALSRNREDRDFVHGLIDALTAYEGVE